MKALNAVYLKHSDDNSLKNQENGCAEREALMVPEEFIDENWTLRQAFGYYWVRFYFKQCKAFMVAKLRVNVAHLSVAMKIY